MEKKLSHASIILEISRNDMRRFKLDFAKKKWTELSVGYVLLPGKNNVRLVDSPAKVIEIELEEFMY